MATKVEQLELFAQDIRARTALEAGTLGFQSPHLVACTLPYRPPGRREFERRLPWATLSLYAIGDHELPSGTYPRLHLAHVIGSAVRTKSATVHLGSSYTEYARQLGLSRGSVGRFREQILNCRWTLWTVSERKRDKDGRQWTLSRDFKLFDAYAEADATEEDAFDPIVSLTPEFFAHVEERSVPLDLRVVNALAQTKSPLAMDLYQLLTWKSATNKGPEAYPYADLMRQLGQGMDPAKRNDRKKFKAQVERVLEDIVRLWPELRVDTDARKRGMAALKLVSTRPHVARKLVTSG